jgi:hypothetical protein
VHNAAAVEVGHALSDIQQTGQLGLLQAIAVAAAAAAEAAEEEQENEGDCFSR